MEDYSFNLSFDYPINGSEHLRINATNNSTSRKRECVVDLTSDSDEEVEFVPNPTKKYKIQEKIIESEKIPDEINTNEKRAVRYVQKPTAIQKERLSNGQRDRIYLIQQKPYKAEMFEREFVILGTTGNVYDVKISTRATCTCKEFKTEKTKTSCKHIYFILTKIFKVDSDDLVIHQKAFLKSELQKIFSTYGPQTTSMADSMVTEKYLELTSADRSKKRKEVPQKVIDGDCPICFEKLKKDDIVVYCKYSCGNNVHKACFDQWQNTKRESSTDEMKCIYCRQRWDSNGAKDVHIKDGYLNLASYQDRIPDHISPSYYWLLPELLRYARFSEIVNNWRSHSTHAHDYDDDDDDDLISSGDDD